MNKEEATKFLALIKIAYPKAYRNMDNDSIVATVLMWQNTFSDVPYAIMEMVLDHYRKKSEFEPTVASIYKELKTLYYTALGDVLSSGDEMKIKLGNYIMEHTSRFKDGPGSYYEINYSSLAKLVEAENKPLLDGGQGVVV